MGGWATTGAPNGEDLAAIREQAAAWVVRLAEAGADTREHLQAECDAWQAADPRRRRVLEQMQEMWSAVHPGQKRRRRRAGALGLVLLLGAVIAGQLPWNVWTADYRTMAGEICNITLPDGSTVVLDSDSAMDVDYGEDRRGIRLERGELLVTVREDAAGRPFRVITEHGIAAARGTRYGVRLEEDHSVVTVHESRVRLVPREARDHGVILAAGQRARLTSAEVTDVESTERRLPDWADRRLVFNDVPLAEVVERLGQYRRGWLMLAGDLAGHDRRFTGVLPADDSDAALAVLADALSLRIRRVTPYLVWLQPQD